MKIFRIGLVVSALAFAGVGVFNCGGSSDSADGGGGSAGSNSGGGKAGGGGSASGGGGGSASGGGGGSASGGSGSGGSASGGSGGASTGGKGGGGAGGGGAGGAGGAMGGAGGAMGGAGGTSAVVTYDGAIKAILANKCMTCHTTGGSGGFNFAAMWADTQKNSVHCPGKKVGECIAIRVADGSMPKGKGCSGNPTMDAAKTECLTKAQQDDLKAWVTGGLKEK